MTPLDVARAGGIAAFVVLLATLATSPLGLDRHRRTLGLATAALATLHGGYALWSPLVPELRLIFYEPHPRAGAAAWFVLFILAVTSFPKLFKVPHWKELHRAVYAASILAFMHVLLSSHAPVWLIGIFGAVLALLLALRLVNRKR